MSGGQTKVSYDCTKCVAFCCSIYERVEVTPNDLRRLAAHFELTIEKATKRFTAMRWGGRVLRRQKDPIFGRACRFLNLETRGCTIYHARPKACREYPGRSKCSYYDVLRFEREIQQDQDIVPIVRLTFLKRSR